MTEAKYRELDAERKRLEGQVTTQSNAQLEFDLRERQRNMIYNSLRKRNWNQLEDFRRSAIRNEWEQGYQTTPIFSEKWKENDPIIRALRKDEELRRLKPEYTYGSTYARSRYAGAQTNSVKERKVCLLQDRF